MKLSIYTLLCFFLSLALPKAGSGQFNSPAQLGLVGGFGKQDLFPFKNDAYFLETKFLKFQMIWPFKEYEKSRLEFVFEPSYYRTDHQLLDPEFVQDNYGDNYLELREEYTQLKSFNEFSLNLGIRYLYSISRKLKASILISLGPTYHNIATERLAKGLAFSDVGAIGLMYDFKKFLLDTRLSVRHVSNASLRFPNSGHNSTNFEIGVLFPINNQVNEK